LEHRSRLPRSADGEFAGGVKLAIDGPADAALYRSRLGEALVRGEERRHLRFGSGLPEPWL
jgi:hypothetical protein